MIKMPRTLNLPQGPLDGLPPVATYRCLRTAEPIVVDGRLDEPVWQRATWSAPFVKMDTGAPVSLDSRVALVWDDTCLYAAYRYEDQRDLGHARRASRPRLPQRQRCRDLRQQEQCLVMSLASTPSTPSMRYSGPGWSSRRAARYRAAECLLLPGGFLLLPPAAFRAEWSRAAGAYRREGVGAAGAQARRAG